MSQSELNPASKVPSAKRKRDDSDVGKETDHSPSETKQPMAIGIGPIPCFPTIQAPLPPLPPPIFGMSSGLLKKRELPHYIKPKDRFDVDVKMKTIHWKTIAPQKLPENSFWVKCQGSKLDSKDIIQELTERFPLEPAKTLVQLYKPLKTKKDADLRVIDINLAQNILISLHALLKNASHDQIKQSILRCDTSTLKSDVVKQLIQCLPPPHQIVKLQDIKSVGDELAVAEQFLVTLGEVHGLVPRLHSISFKLRATDEVDNVEQSIMTVLAACEEIKMSKKFAQILELILELGNYINAGSEKGQAYGFEIFSLSKLMDTKDSNNKKTFLHFVVETIARKLPECLNFGEEISHTEKAAYIRLKNISDTIDEMNISLNQLKSNLDSFKTPQSSDDMFVEVMADFAVQIEERMDKVMIMMNKMKNFYTELTEYYALDVKNYPMELFFGEIESFKKMFAQAHKENLSTRQVIRKRDTHDQTQPQPLYLKTVNHSKKQEQKQMGTDVLQQDERNICRDFKIKLTRLSKSELTAALGGTRTKLN